MATTQLKRYQETAVDELVLKSKMLLAKRVDKRTIVFKAPTGSGKTFMMSQYIERVIKELEGEDVCFLWVSIGKGGLHKQSCDSLKKIFDGFPRCVLLEEEFTGARKTIEKNEVVVVNWGKLVNKDKKTGEWKNVLMKDKETTNFRELVRNTKDEGTKMVLIIDESHNSASSERALELRDVISADLTIEMSATPSLGGEQYHDKVVVDSYDVVEEGMIKKEIVVNEGIDVVGDDESTSQDIIMEAACRKRESIRQNFEQEGVNIHPLCIVQIASGQDGEDKRMFVEHFLAEKGVTVENGKLAVWLSEEKVNLEVLENNASEVEYLIFKQAIDTGWDCPRAHILVKFRETQSEVFELQTVGRILRMPEARHYDSLVLDRAYIYTNIQSDRLDFKGNESSLKNAIKSIPVKRREDYTPLRLRSYYRSRVDFGDLTMSFYDVLAEEFCAYFDISPVASEKAIQKNMLKFAKEVDIANLANKDTLILNKQLDTKLFDHLSDERIRVDTNFQAHLSEDDKEKAFQNLIRQSLHGYAYKRSVSIFYGALFSWFKRYVGISHRVNNGAIYIQNIILNNAETFEKLFSRAVEKYHPVKKAEIKKKIEEVEEWNSEWEIAKERRYSDIYKPKEYQLALYRNPEDKKAYLNIDSAVEEHFIEFLEKNKHNVLWWWQNGNEHMALNFGIKYGEGSTFQPDFLVQFVDGRLGIFDTKASGDREDNNKIKAEALQKYIKEENKRKKKNMLWGGIVIEVSGHLRLNADEAYVPFVYADSVSEGKEQYGTGSSQKGWQYFTCE
jgi:type III restriction enzyme